MNKKRYLIIIAIIIFIFLALFTFANPLENGEGEPNDNRVLEEIEEDDLINNEQNDTEIEEETEENTPVYNNHGVNIENILRVEDNSYELALNAVVRAEVSLEEEKYNIALDLVSKVTDEDKKEVLEERLEIVLDTMELIKLVNDLVEMTNEAENKVQLDSAREYQVSNDIIDRITQLVNETLKDSLNEQVDTVLYLLNDETAPIINIDDEAILKDVVVLNVQDENTFTITLTKEGEESKEISNGTEVSDGFYTLTVIDESFNEKTITFIVDTEIPQFIDVESGSHSTDDIEIKVKDMTLDYIEVYNQDTNKINKIFDNATTLEDEATYHVTAYDKAGNKNDIWVAIDRHSPTITTNAVNGETYKEVTVKVEDKFLTEVLINGEKQSGIVTVGSNNEDREFVKTFDVEGTYTIVAKDKVGNISETLTFNIDRTPAVKYAVNANVNGYKNEVKTQYATNGNTITAYFTVNEELISNPTFTFYTNGKEVKVINGDDVILGTTSNPEYPYKYTAKLNITEELVAEDGVITFVVSNIYNKAGYKTKDIVKMTPSGKSLTLDRTPNRVIWTSFLKTNENVYGNDHYVTNGDTVTYRIGTSEKFKTNPVVTIGGKVATVESPSKFATHYEYRATIKIDVNETNMKEGIIPITISNVTDEVGNKGFTHGVSNDVISTITELESTNGKKLIYDRTAPYRESADFYVSSVNPVNGVYYALKGNTLVANVATNEELKFNPTFIFMNNGKEYNSSQVATWYDSANNKYYYQTKLDIPSEMEDGEITFKVTNIVDKAGNVKQELVVGPSNGHRVVLDENAPIVVASYTEKTVEGNKDIEFTDFPTFTVKDATEVTKTVTGKVDMGKTGTYELVYSFIDLLGRTTTKTIKVIVVDTTSPIVTAIKDGNGNKEITVELGSEYTELGALVTDNIDKNRVMTAPTEVKYYDLKTGYDVNYTKYLNENGIFVNTNKIGQYLLIYVTKDAAGNISDRSLYNTKRTITVKDTTAPTYKTYKGKGAPILAKDEVKPMIIDGELYFFGETTFSFYDLGKIKEQYVDNWSFTNSNQQGVPKTISTPGKHTIKMVDASGNATEVTFTILEESLKVNNVSELKTALSNCGTIYLGENITVGENLNLTCDVTLVGGSIVRDVNYTETLFTINEGVTLDMKNVTIDGNNNWSFDYTNYNDYLNNMKAVETNNDAHKFTTLEAGKPVATKAMIVVNGNLNLSGSTIKNHVGNDNARVIHAINSNAKITTTNTTITHCTSTYDSVAIYMAKGGQLEINEGTLITRNHAGRNGAMIRADKYAKVIMNGGKISDNTSVNTNGTAIMVWDNSTFEMNGGEISNNSSVIGPKNGRNAAVYVHSNSTVIVNKGTISNNKGAGYGGIDAPYQNNATVVINGGNIVDNVSIKGRVNKDLNDNYPSDSDEKGAITVNGGTFTQDVSKWVASNKTIVNNGNGTWTVK